MAMSRKDYRQIIDVLAEEFSKTLVGDQGMGRSGERVGINKAVLVLAKAFAETNPTFDMEKFVTEWATARNRAYEKTPA